MEKNYYVYVYLNQLKEGNWNYRGIKFKYQPFYVGKGTRKREIMHLCPSMLKQKNVKNSVIRSIINQCCEYPIHYRIFENLTNEEAIKIEKDFIKFFGRIDQKTGILANGTDGGDGANNFSEETKKKIGKNRKKKVYQYDLEGNFIKEWESLTSIESIIDNVGNISTAIKRNGTFNGFIWSYEFKEKVLPKIRYQAPIKFENIKQIDTKTNQIIATFDNTLEAEKQLGLRKGARNKIYDCINKKLKTAYGFKWEI